MRRFGLAGAVAAKLAGSASAQNEPLVTFHVAPSRACVYFEKTTLSSNDQDVLLGPQGSPIRLGRELRSAGRDSFVLIFRDPEGQFQEHRQSFGKFELSGSGQRWPRQGELQLQPRTWKGKLERWRAPLAVAGALSLVATAAGALALRRGGQAQLALLAEKQAREHRRRADEHALEQQREVERQRQEVEQQRQQTLRAEQQAMLARQQDPLLEVDLLGYRTRALLGRGAMGRVYRAERVDHDHPGPHQVAIKFIECGPQLPLERMESEARIHKTLIHPHVVRCFECGTYGEHGYLILELVEGGQTLESWVRPGGLPAHPLIARLKPIFSALYFAHQRGIVHRDLKPENIMLTPQGEPKVSDFGVAREESSSLTQTGMILGSLPYLSPEQCESSRRVVPQSDQYSLGIMVFELLTGERPFRHTELLAIISAHLSQPAPSLPSRPDLTPTLNAALQRMLAKEPEARFASLVEAYRALEAGVAAPSCCKS